jgi:hypothetical protein
VTPSTANTEHLMLLFRMGVNSVDLFFWILWKCCFGDWSWQFSGADNSGWIHFFCSGRNL